MFYRRGVVQLIKSIKRGSLLFESFSGLYDFIETINARENNGQVGTSSERLNTNGWAGTNTYEEAMTQVKTGREDVCKKLSNNLISTCARGNERKRKIKRSVYGYKVNIPAAIAGKPAAMYRKITITEKVKTVDLVYSLGQNGDILGNELFKAGKTVLEIVNLLENDGQRVKLRVLPKCSDIYEKHFCICSVTLKNYGDKLDLLKLSFPLVSPAMFRRFGFRWLETSPEVKHHVGSGYGRSFGTHKGLLDYLRECNVFDNNALIIDYPLIKTCGFSAEEVLKSQGLL